jgi:hypothetical protein
LRKGNENSEKQKGMGVDEQESIKATRMPNREGEKPERRKNRKK